MFHLSGGRIGLSATALTPALSQTRPAYAARGACGSSGRGEEGLQCSRAVRREGVGRLAAVGAGGRSVCSSRLYGDAARPFVNVLVELRMDRGAAGAGAGLRGEGRCTHWRPLAISTVNSARCSCLPARDAVAVRRVLVDLERDDAGLRRGRRVRVAGQPVDAMRAWYGWCSASAAWSC